MIKVPVFNAAGDSAGHVDVDEALFGSSIAGKVLHQVLVRYQANLRQGNSSTKGRGEVEGSTKKPWKQKHTGRARVGSIRSPIWRHGGITFGPKPRDYYREIPKGLRHRALDSAFIGKLKDGEVRVLEALQTAQPKTKWMAGLLKKIGVERSCLLAVESVDRNIYLSLRNLQRVDLRPVKDLNAYDLLRHKDLVLTRPALNVLLAERAARKSKKKAAPAAAKA